MPTSITLSDPVTVALAPPQITAWGPYQFPALAHLPDGSIHLSFHIEADSAQAYGLPQGRAVSMDEGRSWRMLTPADAPQGWDVSWQSSLLQLPNGDRLLVKQTRSIAVTELALPDVPLATFPTHAVTHAYYRVEDLPSRGRAGWQLYRQRSGQPRYELEQATVRIPGEVRCVTEEVLAMPWFHELFLAPDGAIWSVNYDHRVADGALQTKICAKVLRSVNDGRTFDLWSEITYAPDPAADPHAARRDGFTEPTVAFMPDGSVICLLRTCDGHGVGPLYWARSTDNGRTWSAPVVFDDVGVWPQMVTLAGGLTLAAYGRPGLYIRATADPSGTRWDPRTTVVPPGQLGKDTCSYSALLRLSDDSALLAYSNFACRNAAGEICKGIQVRRVTVRL
jgi:hypothetical protein